MKKSTLAVHAGQRREASPGVVNQVDPSTAFQYIDHGPQYYPRYFNTPNQQMVVEKLAALENTETGMIFSSGMAAISMTLTGLLERGDHVVFISSLYGGTHHFIHSELEKQGIDFSFAGTGVDELMNACRPETKMVFVESPTNPMMEIVDLAGLAQRARARNLMVVIDSTFASPINQNPANFGIDVIVHSGTKYLGGHSDLSFGAVLSRKPLIDRIHRKSINYGGNVNALTCYLIERSLKTLSIRVERQSSNALKIARALNANPQVTRVFYPGLPESSGHAIAARQMTGFGGMLSFELSAECPATDFLSRLELITPAMSLGGVESTAVLPVFASHRLMPEAEREALGITGQLVRLSVGIEDAEDLIDDLQQAILASCQLLSRAGS